MFIKNIILAIVIMVAFEVVGYAYTYNEPPILDPIEPSVFVLFVGDTVSFEISAHDPEGHCVTFYLDNKPDNADFTNNGDGTGTFEWIPLSSQYGYREMIVWVSDFEGAKDSQTVVFSVEKHDPNEPDTCEWISDTWPINTTADSIFHVELWGWYDKYLGMFPVAALSLGFEIEVQSDTAGWEEMFDALYDSKVSNMISVDTFILGPEVDTGVVFTFAVGDTLFASGDYGFTVGVIALQGGSVFPDTISTKIGDLYLRILDPTKPPGEFTIEIDSSFFIPAGAFKYSLTGYGGYAPEYFSKGIVTVHNEIVSDAEDISDDDAVIPKSFELAQNYPNPFNPTTIIKYYVETKGHVQLTIYNILGQEVKTLVDSDMGIGWQETFWDGTNQNGSEVASGVYFYRMTACDFVDSKKMLLMK